MRGLDTVFPCLAGLTVYTLELLRSFGGVLGLMLCA